MVDLSRRRKPSFESGHDAPVTLREQDSYGRWPVATAISRVIDAAPMEWSTRIGLFGRWGDGKTSVLNFLETQQKERHNIVIRYSPWGVSNESSMWRGFCDALVNGLRTNGIAVSFWSRAEYWLRARLDPLATTAKFAGRLAQASGQVPFGSVVGEVLAKALAAVNLTKRDVDRVLGCAGGQRIVVFIDDLDRADPVVIPQLLLALRELLDLPRFAFVLAFDRSIVAAALEKYNPAWGKSGFQFLEKVVDFPFTLPSPSPEQVMGLANTQFLQNCPFVPSATLDEVAKYLPHNPRRLKLFARLIGGMREEVERHDETELDWPLILLLSLLGTESHELTNELVAQITDTETEFMWLYFVDDEAQQEKMMASLRQMVARHAVDSDQNGHMMVLCQALIDECRGKASEGVRYHARFALSPDCITWREFRGFVHQWKASNTPETIRRFVEERSISLRSPVDVIKVELVGTVISHHSDLLEKASNVTAQEAHLQLMMDALENLDLLLQCVVSADSACTLTSRQMFDVWERLLSLFTQWRHFTSNQRESELRNKETETLLAIATAINDPLKLYERLKPWSDGEHYGDARSAKLNEAFVSQIRDHLKAQAIEAALVFATGSGTIDKLRARDGYAAARYFLTAPASPCFNDAALKRRLMGLIEARLGTLDARQDALDWLEILLEALPYGDRFCRPEQRRDYLKNHEDFVELLWRLAVSLPSQYRFLSSILELRKQLIDGGVPETALPVPDWLALSLTKRSDSKESEIGSVPNE